MQKVVASTVPKKDLTIVLPYLGKLVSQLPDDSLNISLKSNIDCYMEKPGATFCNGKKIF